MTFQDEDCENRDRERAEVDDVARHEQERKSRGFCVKKNVILKINFRNRFR